MAVGMAAPPLEVDEAAAELALASLLLAEDLMDEVREAREELAAARAALSELVFSIDASSPCEKTETRTSRAGIGSRDGGRGRGNDASRAGSSTNGDEVGLDLSGQSSEPGRDTASGSSRDDVVGDDDGGRSRVAQSKRLEVAGKSSEE
jgi:hypothetical protein